MQRTPIILSAALALVLPLVTALADAPAGDQASAVNCGARRQEHRALHREKLERKADQQKLAKDEKTGKKGAVKTDEKELQQDRHAIKSDHQALRRDRKDHPCQDVPKAATGANLPR